MTRARALITTALFLAAIVFPSVLHVASAIAGGGSERLAGENRNRAGLPPLYGEGGITDYTEGVEAWMSDHFGGRGTLLAVHRKMKDALRLEPSGRVHIGRDAWLFIREDGVLTADIQGRRSDPPGHLSAWADQLAALSDLAPVTAVLIAPDKATVYPEKLPAYIKPDPKGTRRVAVVPRLREAGLTVVDPLPALLLGKPDGQVYHATDTHWTDAGAYIAYTVLMEALAERGVQAPVLTRDDLVPSETQGFQGDLVRLLGSDRFSETRADLAPSGREPSRRTIEIDGIDPALWPTVYGGGPADAPSLVVSGDSFVEAMVPYLARSFSTVTVVRRQPVVVERALLEGQGADVFLFLTVERMMLHPLDIR